MKAFTDLPQSKKLAEFLPPESADMYYDRYGDPYFINNVSIIYEHIKNDKYRHIISCWSLAALLETLDFPALSKDRLGSGRTGWMVSIYLDNCRYDSCWHDNPIDCCYEMITRLHEQKLL